MLLRKLRILLLPLLIRLVVYTAILAAMVAVPLLLFALFSDAGAAGLWIRMRPGIFAFETLYVAIAVFAWLAELHELRRKLRHKQVSLREFVSWPLDVRNAWVNAD